MRQKMRLDRREFLKVGTAAGGGLLVGLHLPLGGRLARAQDEFDVNTWIRVGGDNTIVVQLAHSEMGQGVHTGLSMLVAEEIGFRWRRMRGEMPPADPKYANKMFGIQGTGGSTSLRSSYLHLRKAGAAIRQMLIEAAAQRWGLPVSQIEFRDEFLVHVATGHYINFGALAEAAAEIPPPAYIQLKDPAEWSLIGTSPPRLDVPEKTDGTAQFGIDVDLDRMFVATVAQAPVFGGKLVEVDPEPAKKIRGVAEVLALDNAVIVVANGYWPAKKGLEALSPVWWDGPGVQTDDAQIRANLESGLNTHGAIADEAGDVDAARAAAYAVHDYRFDTPYLAHATMEPMNATARPLPDGGVEIWAPTQSQHNARETGARIMGVDPDRVIVHTTYLGGGFGRRIESDYVAQAVHAARAMRAAVKLIWSREEDMRHDYYRPATMARFRVAVDEKGYPAGWEAIHAGPSLMASRRPDALENGVDRTAVEGSVRPPYALANRRISYNRRESGVPVGFWRSVAHSHNAFYVESVMDDLARKAAVDPLEYRLDMLKEAPRHRAVLQELKRRSRWNRNPPKGRYRGLALHESFGSIAGQVAEISLDGDGGVRLYKVFCVIDCGRAVHPDQIEAQMEGGIAFGLTALFEGEINIDAGRVRQGNFPDYRMLMLAQMPAIDVHIIEGADDGEGLGGVGEPGTPPIAPAVANAIFAATGRRIRSLPLAKHGFALV